MKDKEYRVWGGQMAIIVIRSMIMYVLISFALRIMGKRQLGELQPSELAVTILVSNIATLPMEDTNIPLVAGIIPILAMMSFEVIVSYFALKNKRFKKILVGSPVVVIKDGKIDQNNLKELRINADDLITQLRAKDIFDIREVDFAAIETTGSLSVYKKYGAQEVTAEMLSLEQKKGEESPQIVIVSDGSVIEEGLRFCNLNKAWLDKILITEKRKLSEVFLMTCNNKADYVIIKNELKRKGKK